MMLSLNLPAFEHKIKKKDGKLYIWDRIRRKYIMLQPEEWVRQHFVNYLIEEKKVPASLISLELGQQYNTLSKRCDIVVWDQEMKPLILIECKASHIPISKDTFFQATTYNTRLNVKYLILTNGIIHKYFIFEESGFFQLGQLPDFDEIARIQSK
jgi:hypothetical protein